MRKTLPLVVLLSTSLMAQKLTFDERVELVRGLMAEYATAKTFLPRSKKALDYDVQGTWDKKQWDAAGKEFGPAARVGDIVQITKVDLEDDKIVLELNGGMKSKRKWYENIEVGMGTRTTPVSQRQPTAAPGGTTIALLFHKPLTAMPASELKKLLAPILDFEKRSATEQVLDSLPPEIKQAVVDKRAVEGMDRDQVIMAIGKPRTKTRETKEGVDLEDWIYGMAPGRVTFVTFEGNKVVKVKETYAGLGGQTAPPLRPVQ
ncbi:MAG TPA: hypothetical protein VE621_17185 [Bryobacteraceae bacterium]|nr:hypothetical protein [Bryobacteraceae bacterium]